MKLLEQQAVAGISIKNVLFATDFSEASTAALPYALAVAGRYGSTLHMAHVVPDTNFVMMTGGIDPISIGTIYDRAHTNARCYSTEGEADFPCAKLELKRVLYATDFATSSLIAASIAMSFAREFQAHLVMLHVMREYIDLHKKPGPIEKTLRRLEEMIPETSGLWFEPEAVVKFGDPSYEILDVAREQKADLIVLGVRPAKDHPSASAHSPWATAHQVIAGARCPVLTVRG